MAKQKLNTIIAVHAPVQITAAEGDAKGPGKFEVTAYNGGALEVGGWDRPVVIDIDGMDFHKNVIANLGHDSEQFVGHVTDKAKVDHKINLGGVFSAETAARDTIVKSAANGFPFEASVEVTPKRGGVESIDAGKSVKVNGQSFDGPVYVARKSTLTGFGFVLRGADPETVVSIAANAASKEHEMRKEVKAWFAKMCPSVDIEALSDEEVASIEANYDGQNGNKPIKATVGNSPFEAQKLEAKRREEIQAISNKLIERKQAANNGYISEADITAIEKLQDHAIESEMSPVEYKAELQEAVLPFGVTIRSPKGEGEVNAAVVEAAICVHGRLGDAEKQYSDKVLQAAHNRFRHSIGLGEILMLAAQAGGYSARPGERVTDGNLRSVLQAVFSPIRGQGWSTFSLPVTLGNVANKFIREGWNFVEQEWREISTIRSVSDFKEITTVSLFDGLMYESLSPNGEIKHGSVGETTYGNKVDTYARMFAVDRRDIINDDLGALTQIPRKLGRGAGLKLNDVFWTEFLDPSVANFWHSSHANINEGVADMTIGGLEATELIFMQLIGPDGNLLGSIPRILLVPPGSKSAALTLMSSERLIDGTSTAKQGDANIWKGRFKVVCSQYLGISTYTGYDANAYYMLADPNDISGIEVAALNGRVEPQVDTADADFNTLGIQMRGYCDVGVRVQEPLCGVRADGGSS